MVQPRACVTDFSHLTRENLTTIFQHYYRSPSLGLTVLSEGKRFTGLNDQFQSEIEKWLVKVWEVGGQEREVSLVAKTVAPTNFQKWGQRLTRQFFTEVFWYKYALPELGRDFPEIVPLSPVSYLACSNYEDSYLPDQWDRGCGTNYCGWMCRSFHHKNEEGMLEDCTQQRRHNGLPSMVALEEGRYIY